MNVSYLDREYQTYKELYHKPLILKTREEITASIEQKMKRGMVLNESSCSFATNDVYRNSTIYRAEGKNGSNVFLDFEFLFRDETSCLKGTLSNGDDVDYYKFNIPYDRKMQNFYDIDINMELTPGSDYRLFLYDVYGNQVGEAKWSDENKKTITIPNFNPEIRGYCIKIENGEDEFVSADECYKISFKIYETDDHSSTDKIHDAFCKTVSSYESKGDWKSDLEALNELLQESEQQYETIIATMQEKQFSELPVEKQYKGEDSIDTLLQKYASGEKLEADELEYLKIFANLKDYEKAANMARLYSLSDEIVGDFEERGIDTRSIEGVQISINEYGKAEVLGNIDDSNSKLISEIIEEKYEPQLYRYYIGIADSILDLRRNVYEYSTGVQETLRFLKKVSGKEIALNDLKLGARNRIGGLPEKADNIINKTKNNVNVEYIRDVLIDLIQNVNRYGESEIPKFKSTFKISNGKFVVDDSGFIIDTDILSEKMSPHYSGNMYSDMYDYQMSNVF